MSQSMLRSPEPSPLNSRFLVDHDDDDDDDDHLSEPHFSDGDTASQKSIALSSPPISPRDSISLNTDSLGLNAPDDRKEPIITPVSFIRQSLSSFSQISKRTLDTDDSSEADGDDRSFFARKYEESESPVSSIAPSLHDSELDKTLTSPLVSPPQTAVPFQTRALASPPPAAVSPPLAFSPPPSASSGAGTPPDAFSPRPSAVRLKSDTESIMSVGSTSSYSKKARPESIIIQKPQGQLVLGIALVDFNHLVGPKIEMSRGPIFDDEEICKILPFLALPDGAHLTTEDYSYFHVVPSTANPTTIFGISCNRQISAADLLAKDADVTRSTVQKAVVVLASKPIFGPIRDRLGVITRALFEQRDFSDTSILDDFYSSLEQSVRGQMTESGLYMGTNLRELVHTFRQRTLLLVKALMLQKRIMFFGHPVEKLCTYQYSLVTLVPGLLQNLDDCGSPPLAARAQTLSRPTSLKTSDPKSMMAYMGLPLDLFGKDAFFQPYLPLQQLDMLKDTKSWLCGSTNSIVTQQSEIDLLVNIETGTVEFRNPDVERCVALTAEDRKWMDDIVRDVNEGYSDDPDGNAGLHFRGSEDYLRQKFDEYINGALSSVKYSAFLAKGKGAGVLIDGAGDPNSPGGFNLLWIQEFRKSHAYEVWERVTDPMLFDLVEPRHPCTEKPSVVSDIGLRLTEGIQELKLDQQLAPTREAISRTITAGSTNFFNAVDGVRARWMQRNPSSTSSASADSSTSAYSADSASNSRAASPPRRPSTDTQPPPTPKQPRGLRPLSIVGTPPPPPEPPRASFGGWGAGIGSFFRAPRLSVSSISSVTSAAAPAPARSSTLPPPPVPSKAAPPPAPVKAPSPPPRAPSPPAKAPSPPPPAKAPSPPPPAAAKEEPAVSDAPSAESKDSEEGGWVGTAL